MTTKKQDPTSILIKSYFENNDFSDQTSSHWRKYGNLQKIQKIGGSKKTRITFNDDEVKTANSKETLEYTLDLIKQDQLVS